MKYGICAAFDDQPAQSGSSMMVSLPQYGEVEPEFFDTTFANYCIIELQKKAADKWNLWS